MKKRIIISALIVTVAAMAAAPLVLAGPHRGGPGGHGFGGPMAFFGHLHKIKEELDLSDAQVSQIRAIVAETREQNAPYREQMHGNLKGVAETLLANPNDVAAAQAILDQQAAAERALKTNMLGAASKALAVLNAEQREKLGTMLDEFAERHGRR